MLRHPSVAVGALILVNLVWSTAYALSKVLMDGTWAQISPLALSFWRLLLASLILFPLAWAQRPRRPLTLQEWGWLGLAGIVGSAGSMLLQFVGTHLSSATNAAVIVATETVFNVVLAALFLGERMSRRGVFGLVLALVGVLLLNDLDWHKLDLFGGRYALGNGILLLSMLCYALYALAGKFAVETLPPMVVTGYPFLMASIILGAVCAKHDPAGLTSVLHWSWKADLSVLYLGVIVTAATYLGWNAALVHVTVTAAALTLYVQPVFGAIIGWAILGEHVSASTVAGGIIVLVAVALVTLSPHQPGSVREVNLEPAGMPTDG